MAQSYYTRQLLSERQLREISELLPNATWSKSKEDLIEYYPKYQSSSEMVKSEVRNRIAELVMNQVNADIRFYDRVFPRQSTAVIISKTSEGEGLKIHHDNAKVGEFSTTVFLSDPETYEGGELCLWYEGQEQKFKLPAGHAITYSTGAPHMVAPVTSGSRIVAVFWTTSSIRDPRHREVLSGMRQIRRLLPEIISYDFDEVVEDPAFQLLEIENKFIRYFVNPAGM